MSDYTEEQLKDAARKALADGNTDAAKRFVDAARAVAAPSPEAAPKPPSSSRPKWTENIWASGEADTFGEKLGQYIRGGTAAVARGMADVPALPVNVAQLGAMGVEKLFGMDDPSMVSRALDRLPDTRDMLGAVPVLGPESRYKAPGKVGEFLSTAGEFAGGAGLMSGAKTMLKYGLAPGLASETAGQATEGTAAEPYARTAAALAAPFAVGAAQKGFQRVVSPMAGKLDPSRMKAVETLREAGVTPTAGQVVGGRTAESQLYREAATASGRALADDALEDFTAAAMKSVGSTARKATPDALEEATSRIGSVFDDAIVGVEIAPSTQDLTAMSKALEVYRQLAPKTAVAPIFKNINKELVRAFRSGNPIPAESVAAWRSNLSKLTTSADPAARGAAVAALDAVDDAISTALVAAGKPEVVAKLSEARNHYRNLLALESAAQRSDTGIITPAQLRNALLVQGRRRYVQGKGDLGPLTRAGVEVLDSLPNSGTQQRLSAGQLASGAASGTGAGLGAFGLGVDPFLATGIGAAATAAPFLRNQFLSSGMGQKYFLNQLMQKAGPAVTKKGAAAMLPGLLAQ
jgi:hypothetical protein